MHGLRTTMKYVYLLTPWCRVLLEKLTGLQLVKKFPASHGTRRFITALTNVRHSSLPWASPIQSIYPHPTSWRSFLILSTHHNIFTCNKQIRRPLHKLNGKERILGSMGDCPDFTVQATNHITMIAKKQRQANVGLARNTKYGLLTLRQG